MQSAAMHTPGQVAHLLGIHVETLRYYEGLGLLPTPARTAGGRRVYSDETVELLRSIRAARSLGLRISEIQAVLPARRDAERAPAVVLAAFEAALARTRTELKALNHRRNQLNALVSLVRDLEPGADLKTRLRQAWSTRKGAGAHRRRAPRQ